MISSKRELVLTKMNRALLRARWPMKLQALRRQIRVLSESMTLTALRVPSEKILKCLLILDISVFHCVFVCVAMAVGRVVVDLVVVWSGGGGVPGFKRRRVDGENYRLEMSQKVQHLLGRVQLLGETLLGDVWH
ncbi:hypothetical protein MIMGU_mgv1a016119mg [Erythranthe guttata]|uniref:Uncharacterized protein n=1 Tax=Erythranthe guttata TaxID=4155 RepID=A0A022QHV0_ERYGU|nr:hypothetical protein MIMGU_mgv1a016119mg [Erythranthe guttata]